MKKNRKMIRCYLRENNLKPSLKMTFPLNEEEKTINAKQNCNILIARLPPSSRGSMRPQELIKSENSNINEDNYPPDDLP